MLKHRRILIVADDPDQNMLFSMVLKRANYDIVAVEDGESALAHLDKTHFDLVLTDFMLPDVNGDKIIRQIQQRKLTTKTVLMSNHLDVRSIAQSCAADGYFRKEDITLLVTLIASLLPSNNGAQLSA